MAENVVIVASQKRPLGGRELQLPSMSMLTSKTSTQKFFLRVLQVIIQLRDDTRRANKKAKQTGRLGMELECPIEEGDDGGASVVGLGVVVAVDPESLEEQG